MWQRLQGYRVSIPVLEVEERNNSLSGMLRKVSNEIPIFMSICEFFGNYKFVLLVVTVMA